MRQQPRERMYHQLDTLDTQVSPKITQQPPIQSTDHSNTTRYTQHQDSFSVSSPMRSTSLAALLALLGFVCSSVCEELLPFVAGNSAGGGHSEAGAEATYSEEDIIGSWLPLVTVRCGESRG